MKDSDLIGRSSKKTNGTRTIGKLSSSSANSRSNGATPSATPEKSKSERKRTKLAKSMMGDSLSKQANDNKSNKKPKAPSSATAKKSSPNGKSKSSDRSPELRPRRRASQTYFFKYQLAKNPLKAEEEDLKMALLASLQQCNSNETSDSKSSNRNETNNKVLTKKEPPDEDYLKKYKPETEDFLTFICFRTTAPNYQSLRPTTDQNSTIANGKDDTSSTTASNRITGNYINGFRDKRNSSNEQANLINNYSKLNSFNNNDSKTFNISNSPTNSNNNNNNCINNNNNHTDQNSPNNHRRPTRQSPRLASSIRKISENDSLNQQNTGTSNTAYDNSINYEEDMKRASIALEDMAQEINTFDDIHNELAQDSQDCLSKSSTSPYKSSNKHLVKGLMTREFAGAFADEETIFESISNHKL